MRSAERNPIGRLAIVVGVLAIVFAVTVPGALGRSTAGGPVTNYLTYVGGKAGKANPKLSPVVIGVLNTQGGQVLIGPNWTKGAELAAKYVNTYLGGVQGHPLVLSECFTTSAEEDGTKCGQKFANDKRISVIAMGAVAVGNQSFYAALGGKKPIVSGVALLPVDATQKNEFALFGTNDSVLGPWGTFAKTQLHAKTAAVIYPQVPDIVVPQSNAAGCVNVAKTLQQLGVPGSKVVSNPLCLSGDVVAGLGGDLAPWIYGIASTLPGDKTDKAAVPYNKAMAQLGQAKLAGDAWVIVSWGEILTIVKEMNALGVANSTAPKLTTAIRGFKGPQALGAPSLDCGKYKTEPAACNDQTQFFQYQGKGVFKRLTSWLRPPANFTPEG